MPNKSGVDDQRSSDHSPTNQRAATAKTFGSNPPKHKPLEIYARLISAAHLEVDRSQRNMFFCVFYVHDGSSRFRINKSTTKSYLQTPEVHSKNGNPKWDCFEEFPVKTEKDYLTIKVFRDKTKLGRLNIPCWDVPLEKGETFTLPICPKKKRGYSGLRELAGTEMCITIEVYVSKHEPFNLPADPKAREKFLQGYFKAMRNMRDVVLLNSSSQSSPVEEMIKTSDEGGVAILTFLPTSSPTASRTKIHIRGRGLGASKNDIKSIHICGLDVTATLEHLNSTSLKVTTSFWKESMGKIIITFKDGTFVESAENFEFIGGDINSLAPGNTRASSQSIYTEFVPRSKSTQQSVFEEDDKVEFTGEIDFRHHEEIYQRGTNDELKQNYRTLIHQSKAQQKRLQQYMQHSEKLMMIIVEEAPHLMARTKQIKKKDSIYKSSRQESLDKGVNEAGGVTPVGGRKSTLRRSSQKAR